MTHIFLNFNLHLNLQVKKITIFMPNAHYFDFDFTKFPLLQTELNKPGLGDVYLPLDKPSGIIESTLERE